MDLSIKSTLKHAWGVFENHVWMFMLASLIIIGASVVIDALSPDEGAFASIIGILVAILMWWLYMGFIKMGFSADAGGEVKIEQLFSGKGQEFGQFLIGIIGMGVIVAIGFILLIVPGIIANLGLMLVPLLIVDKKMKGIDAIKESWRITKGYKGKLFWVMLVLALINIGGMILFGIGLLITVPLTILSIIHIYKQFEKGVVPAPMKQEGGQMPPAQPQVQNN